MLTFVVAAAALVFTGSGPIEVTRSWGDGLISLLAFITQICLVIILGYILANLETVKGFLAKLASIPRSPRAAYAFVTAVAGVTCLISWAFGLIVGGVLAVQVAGIAHQRGVRLHYPLLVACVCSGTIVWHMGYSASGPLAAATPGSFFEELGGVVPVSQTILAPWNLVAIAVTLSVVVLAMSLLSPKEDDPISEPPEIIRKTFDNHDSPTQGADTENISTDERINPADRMERARILSVALGIALAAYLGIYFVQEGFVLTLNIVNWSFLTAILLLAKTPKELIDRISESGRTVGPILIQYPLYAGIFGIVTTTGLAGVLGQAFVNISTQQTLGVWAFISGALLNIFVPSGGGQFAVQAPVFMEAANQLDVAASTVIMGIAYGDQLTNMIQPIWMLPLLAVAGLRVRDIMGYTIIAMLVSIPVFVTTLLLVGGG
jgi:short-chain fatty acids transporter